MKATYGFDLIAHFRLLVEQKDVPPKLLQEFYDAGVLADLLEVRKPKELDREAFRKACGLPPFHLPLLEPIGTVTVPGLLRFVAREKFVLDYDKKAKSGVWITWLCVDFQKWFLGKIEEPTAEVTVRYAKLTRSSVDGPILDELGGVAEITLGQFFSFLERQPNGESGPLLTNWWANIAYIRDVSGQLRAVHAFWSAAGGGWDVRACLVGHPLPWSDGCCVLSCNSLDPRAV